MTGKHLPTSDGIPLPSSSSINQRIKSPRGCHYYSTPAAPAPQLSSPASHRPSRIWLEADEAASKRVVDYQYYHNPLRLFSNEIDSGNGFSLDDWKESTYRRAMMVSPCRVRRLTSGLNPLVAVTTTPLRRAPAPQLSNPVSHRPSRSPEPILFRLPSSRTTCMASYPVFYRANTVLDNPGFGTEYMIYGQRKGTGSGGMTSTAVEMYERG